MFFLACFEKQRRRSSSSSSSSSSSETIWHRRRPSVGTDGSKRADSTFPNTPIEALSPQQVPSGPDPLLTNLPPQIGHRHDQVLGGPDQILDAVSLTRTSLLLMHQVPVQSTARTTRIGSRRGS